MKRVLTVIGARPQFVKASAVTRLLREQRGMREVLVHTGQHYDPAMSDVFFAELGLPEPDHYLGIGSMPHGAQTGAMLAALETVMRNEHADLVLVYGDTNSTLAGALAAAKLQIPVAHVEAGLRSFDRRMPEEINRLLTDHIAAQLFAPTDQAIANLAAEGILGPSVHRTGDIMLDVSLRCAALAETRSQILTHLGLTPGTYVLATLHRQENTDDPARLAAIWEGLARVAARYPVVLPLHPRTRKNLAAAGLHTSPPGLIVSEPAAYLDMVRLEQSALVVATDSGGVQKEAYFFGVPCVTLRDTTEWVELVSERWNRLVPAFSPDAIEAAVLGAIGTRGSDVSLYGDGHAAESIVTELIRS